MLGNVTIRKKKSDRQAGFTIVETLIVLAVTGMLFTAIVVTTSGQQNKARFQQAYGAIVSEIETVINEVQSGYSGAQGSTTRGCAYVSGAPTQTAATTALGTNSQCMFVGKALQFRPGSEEYVVHTVVARNNTNINTNPVSMFPSYKQTKPLYHGLSLRSITGPTSSHRGIIVFLSDFSFNGTDGTATGSQRLRVGALNNSSSDSLTAWDSQSFSTASRYREGTVSMCFSSGTTDQSVRITIGEGGGNTVRSQIRTGKTCS